MGPLGYLHPALLVLHEHLSLVGAVAMTLQALRLTILVSNMQPTVSTLTQYQCDVDSRYRELGTRLPSRRHQQQYPTKNKSNHMLDESLNPERTAAHLTCTCTRRVE